MISYLIIYLIVYLCMNRHKYINTLKYKSDYETKIKHFVGFISGYISSMASILIYVHIATMGYSFKFDRLNAVSYIVQNEEYYNVISLIIQITVSVICIKKVKKNIAIYSEISADELLANELQNELAKQSKKRMRKYRQHLQANEFMKYQYNETLYKEENQYEEVFKNEASLTFKAIKNEVEFEQYINICNSISKMEKNIEYEISLYKIIKQIFQGEKFETEIIKVLYDEQCKKSNELLQQKETLLSALENVNTNNQKISKLENAIYGMIEFSDCTKNILEMFVTQTKSQKSVYMINEKEFKKYYKSNYENVEYIRALTKYAAELINSFEKIQ